MTRISIIFTFAILLAAPPAQALPATSRIAPSPGERHEQPAQAPLPSLHIETCPACELDAAEIAAWQHAYADTAHAAGYTIDFSTSARVRITETGLLPNGAPYAVGETAGLRFRVGDPHPGATLGTALGRMSFVILSGNRKNAEQQGPR